MNLVTQFGKQICFILMYLYITIVIPLVTSFIYMTGQINSCWNLSGYLTIQLFDIQLQQKYIKYLKPVPFIQNGFILTNHRSFTDFFFDPYITRASCIVRRLACFVAGIFGLQLLFESRMIVINRGKDNRHDLWNNILNYTLILFYPEGTRLKHLSLPSNYKEVELKYGLLKSIYENRENQEYALNQVQIFISRGKEDVLNEKIFQLGFNQTITYMVGEPIIPSQYNTFDDFIDKVKHEWHTLWNIVYCSLDHTEIKDSKYVIEKINIPYYV